MPLRTTARITAFRPGQSPPPVNIPIFMCGSNFVRSDARVQLKIPEMHLGFGLPSAPGPKREITGRREELDYHQRGGILTDRPGRPLSLCFFAEIGWGL